jgi:hypothetical protein
MITTNEAPALDSDLVAKILSENASIPLGRIDFQDGAATANLRYSGQTLQQAHIDLLKAAQRTNRVAKGNTKLQNALLQGGYGSAHQIARTGRDAFVAHVGATLDIEEAETLFQEAQKIQAMVGHLTAHLQALVGSKYYSRTMFSTVPAATLQTFQALPGFSDLFGSLDYVDCEDCASLFSPAAYLVDLLRVVETYVVKPSLRARRPDLYSTPLSCDATNTVISYLSIANDILVSTVKTLSKIDAKNLSDSDAAFQVAAMASFPISVPYHAYLARVRTYLGAMKTSYRAVLQSLAALPAAQIGTPDISLETLGLSKELAARITVPHPASADLVASYGLMAPGNTSLEPVATLTNASTFLTQTGLSFGQLNELLNQGLKPDEPNADTLRTNFFINATGENLPPLATVWIKDKGGNYQALQHLSLQRLDRLQRFIRLQTATGWSFEALEYTIKLLGASELSDALLTSLGQLADLCARLRTSIDALWPLIRNLKTSGGGGPASLGDQFDLVFNSPSLLAKNNPYDTNSDALFNPARPAHWDPKGPDPAIVARLNAALGLSNTDLIAIVSFVSPSTDIFPLDLAGLSALVRAARLASLLGYQPAEFLLAAKLFNLPGKPNTSAPTALLEICTFVKAIDHMRGVRLTLTQIDAIISGTVNPGTPNPCDPNTVMTMLGNNAKAAQARSAPLTAKSLVSAGLEDRVVNQVIAFLVTQGFVAQDGFFKDKPIAIAWLDAASLLPISSAVFAGPLITADNAAKAADELASKGLLTTISKDDYQLAKPFDATKDDLSWLSNLFTDSNAATAQIDAVRQALVQAEAGIDSLPPLLLGLKKAQQAIAEPIAAKALSQLFGCQQDLVWPLVACAQACAPYADLTAHLCDPALASGDLQNLLTFLAAVQHRALLAKAAALTANEVTFLTVSPKRIHAGAHTSGLLQVGHILEIMDFKGLVRAFGDSNDALIAYLMLPKGTDQEIADAINALATLTGWPANQLSKPLLPATATDLVALKGVFDLAERVGASFADVNSIGLVSQKSLVTNRAIDQEAWAAWSNAALTLLTAVHSMGDAQIAAAFDASTAATLLPLDRDGLVGVAMSLLNQQPAIAAAIATYEDLYDYLLIDAEMGPAATTSYIAQAISSAQLYLQRVRLGIEGQSSISDELQPVWWEWLSSYRVWQANREIFLYPENYIDPTLRQQKSDIFGNFTNALLQTNINDVTVTSAYTDYVNQLEVRSSLQHCAAFHYLPGKGDQGKETTYIFARTNAAPFDYYYRTWDSTTWSPWRKLSVRIGSPYITPVYAFQRLFIFWIELDQTKSSVVKVDAGQGGGSKDITSVKATIKYSFLNVADTWSPPQTLRSDTAPINFLVDYANTDAITKGLGTHGAGFLKGLLATNPSWQQVQAVRLIYDPDLAKYNAWKEERILINFGIGLSFSDDSQGKKVVQPPDGLQETFLTPDHESFNTAINNFLINHDTCKNIPAKGGSIQYHPLIALDWTLAQTQHTSLLLDFIAGDAIPYGPVLARAGAGTLGIAHSSSVLKAEYYSDDSPAAPLWGKTAPTIDIPLLGAIAGANASVITVKNQPGWFIFNNGNEAFLAQSNESLHTLDEIMAARLSDYIDVTTNNPSQAPTDDPLKRLPPDLRCLYCTSYTKPPPAKLAEEPPPAKLADIKFNFTRLSTCVPAQLSNLVIGGGIAALLSPTAQVLAEPDFATRYQPTKQALPPNSPPDMIDFEGAFGSYFWEIFFHGPLLVANRLNAALRFEEAKRWLEFIFDPTASQTKGKVWRFLPFRKMTPEDLVEVLEPKSKGGINPQIAAYNESPFDPDAIAALRPIAYAKAAAMAYVDNLLDWADSFYAADTAEAINEAMLIYALVSDLLGRPPEQVGMAEVPKVLCFDDIAKAYADPHDIPQFYLAMENFIVKQNVATAAVAGTAFNDLDLYFCVPENTQLIGYWTRLEDRLYKIRHGMNLKGVVRPLGLFAPPINPRALIAAAAAGQPIGPAFAGTAAVPIYRFTVLVERARAAAEQVTALGDALLAALEKRDVAQLEQIRNTQEGALLGLTLQAKEQRLVELSSARDGLVQGQLSATRRHSFYDGLITDGLNAGEVLHLTAMLAGNALTIVGGALRMIAATSYLVPNAGSPFAMTYGGKQIGSSLEADSSELELAGKISTSIAELSLTTAQYERRRQEWELQRDLAGYDGAQIAAQVATNDIETQIAQNDLDAHNASIANNARIADYLTSRFTGQDLYQWIAARLSDLYFQSFNIALDLARSAESAYGFELNTIKSFIGFDYWASERQGLTAGHQLVAAIAQMEKAYFDNNVRALEIERQISLRDIDPLALLNLQQTGECLFYFNELLFDSDFPGHYLRKIKSVSISIPALLAPYQSFNATLTQLSNQIVLATDIDTVSFLLGGKKGDQPDARTLRSNVRPSQAIAISRSSDDSGLFELNFGDDRYLPFEGTGAVSSWRLSLPRAGNRFNLGSISDVVIKFRYTAFDGGDDFRSKVTALPELTTYAGTQVYNLAQNYPFEWHAYQTGQPLQFNLDPTLVPPNVVPTQVKAITLLLQSADGSGLDAKYTIDVKFAGTDLAIAPDPKNSCTRVLGTNVSLAAALANPVTIKSTNADPTKLKTIIFIMLFEGTLNWGAAS